MEIYRNLKQKELPVDLTGLGKLYTARQECPGVFYASIIWNSEEYGTEYYIVTEKAPISEQVRKLGTPFQNALLFSLEEECGRLAQYEVSKYKVRNHLPLRAWEDLYVSAVCGAADNPEYYGMLPVPMLTPWGRTLRNRVLANGIFWLETEYEDDVLAMSHPFWNSELTLAAISYGCFSEPDRWAGIEKAMACLFFTKQTSCVPLYELRKGRWNWDGLPELDALLELIRVNCPEYLETEAYKENI